MVASTMVIEKRITTTKPMGFTDFNMFLVCIREEHIYPSMDSHEHVFWMNDSARIVIEPMRVSKGFQEVGE